MVTGKLMEILTYPFFLRALAGVAIISVAVAIIGVYIMSRRMVFLSGGITHACFGGLGLGYWLGVSPVAMAALSAMAGSLGVEWLSSRSRVRSDSAIAVVWAVGMALGILFIFMTEGYVPELNSFLFGNVLTVTTADLWWFLGFTVVLSAVFLIFYRVIVAVAFDPDFSRVRRLPVRFVNYAMTVMVAVAGFTPRVVAVNRSVPGSVPACTIAVAAPLNRSICGCWNERRLRGSPLAVARNRPLPVTVKRTSRRSVGTMLPALSAIRMVK